MPGDLTRTTVIEPTKWSQVWRAGFGTPEQRREAMTAICESYWVPVFQFSRRFVESQDQAEDLAQGFFEHLLQQDLIKEANPERGRLRTFMFMLLQRHIQSCFAKAKTVKRGGRTVHVPMPSPDCAGAPSDELSPERLFYRQWTLATIEQAMEDTAREAERLKTGTVFQAVRSQLGLDDLTPETTERLAAELKMTEAAVRTALHRWRKRFLENFRRRVAFSIDSTDRDEIHAEIRELRSFL